MKWKWEFDGDHLEAKQTELACDKTFNTVYFVVLNALFRFLLPTICLVVFNVLIYREVSYFFFSLCKYTVYNYYTYRKVASSNISCLEAHAGFFRLLMKGILDSHVL